MFPCRAKGEARSSTAGSLVKIDHFCAGDMLIQMTAQPAVQPRNRGPLRKNPRGRLMARERERTERLQVVLSTEELAAVDEFRFENRLPSRAAAVRELMRRGLLPPPARDAKHH